MVKITATLNAKPKRTEELECSSLEELKDTIDKIFNIQAKNIKFMKPQLKDEAAFEKVKDGMEVLFMGPVRKAAGEVDLKKEEEAKKKVEEKKIEAIKKIEQLKLDDHRKVIDKLKEKKITERGFSYMNEDGRIEYLGTDHYTSPVHLLRVCPDFQKYCHSYEVQPKNPDGLVIEDLSKTFKSMEEEPDKFVDPLDWCSAFIAYCADDIEYPYPTYDFNYIVSKIFLTIKNAFITDAERKEPNATPTTHGQAGALFGMGVNMKKTKLTKLDDDDFEVGKEVEKREIVYVLECDLSSEDTKSYEDGIKERFKEKNIWENFYAFDIEYKQTIVSIENLSRYIFVHINRVGYPPAKDESEEIVLLPNKKSTHKVRTKTILDLSPLCSSALNDKLETGKFERQQLFGKFEEEDEFADYKNELKANGYNLDDYTRNELCYMFFDNKKLFKHDIFDEYYFKPLKNTKQTGEYRINGVVFHRGQYYHHPVPTHNKEEHGHTEAECRGEFMVMVYRKGEEWLKFHDAEIEVVKMDDVLDEKYWGGGEWTPVLILYKEIWIKNIEIDIPDE